AEGCEKTRRMHSIRPLRLAGAFFAAFSFLYVVVASPLARQTEVSWAVPFGMLPIALLIGVGVLVQELGKTGSEARRDGLFGLSSALLSFAILRLAGVI
ncbi:MAG: hypothetical protein ACREQJ_08280, partial [Candidatus Binatia bacterium]